MDKQPEEPKSYIFIKFEDIGSVIMNMISNGVTPLQMLAMAHYLEVKGKNSLIQQENERLEKEAANNIARPKPGILVPD
jgi:hypothetical protein